jgi:predicted small lipoprotein YifL
MRYVLLASTLLSLSGCGVKGDPIPPTTQPRLGRGKASLQEMTSNKATPTQNDDEEKDKEKDKNKKGKTVTDEI